MCVRAQPPLHAGLGGGLSGSPTPFQVYRQVPPGNFGLLAGVSGALTDTHGALAEFSWRTKIDVLIPAPSPLSWDCKKVNFLKRIK